MSWITSEISKRFEITEQLLSKSFGNHLHDLDSGRIDEETFWINIANDVDSSRLLKNSESLWDTYFRKNAKPNQKVINIVREMNSYDLGVISNIEKITHTIVDEWSILDNFEYKFMSYQIGYSKPDPRIYQYVIETLPYEPSQLVLIDDKKVNVEAALNSGMNAIEYTGFENLKRSFDSFCIKN